MGHSMARYIEFKNEGMSMGEFTIEYDEDLPITISPKQGVLHPANPHPPPEPEFDSDEEDEEIDEEEREQRRREKIRAAEEERKASEREFPRKVSERVKIDFHGTEVGAFRAIAKVHMIGQPDRVLDINAMLVEQRLEFVLPEGGGQVSNLPFGTLYFGQARDIHTLLENMFSVKKSAHISIQNGAGDVSSKITNKSALL